jgi:hypothetical protein
MLIVENSIGSQQNWQQIEELRDEFKNLSISGNIFNIGLQTNEMDLKIAKFGGQNNNLSFGVIENLQDLAQS